MLVTVPVTEMMQTTTVQQTMSVCYRQTYLLQTKQQKNTLRLYLCIGLLISKENQSEMETGLNLSIVPIIASIVVITIEITLLGFLVIRRSQRRKGSRYSVLFIIIFIIIASYICWYNVLLIL